MSDVTFGVSLEMVIHNKDGTVATINVGEEVEDGSSRDPDESR